MKHSKSTNVRVDRERQFHDQAASSIDIDQLLIHESFEAPTAIENRYALEQMGDLREKRILDLGCGAGETSVYFALKGARVTACDISSELLKLARQVADKHEVELDLFLADAGQLPLQSESFDFVFGNGVLHHVDLQRAPREISRVLKKGGAALFVEPLPYNPAINVYRALASEVRSQDEKPLSLKQIKGLEQFFSSLKHEEFWFFSLLIFFHFFFIRRWHPSKVRYWKQVLKEGEAYRAMFARLNRLDLWTLKTFPFLRPLCWNTVIVARK